MNRYLSIAFVAFSIFLVSLFGYAITVGPNDIERGAVRGRHIQKNAVKSSDIAKGAVKSSDIRDGGIKTKDMADGAVTGAKIADGTVTGADIANGAVDAAALGNEAVTNTKIAFDAVDTPELADGAVTGAKIADGTVTGADIANGAVDAAALGNEAVTNTKIAFDAVDTPELADGAVTKQKLSSDVTVHGLTGVALVGVADFAMDGRNSNCFFENDGYWQLKNTDPSICCLQAPVHPPHGVRLTGFEGMFMDDGPSAANETTIELEYKDIRDASGNQGLATLVTSEDSTAFQVISDLTLNHVVDAVNYQYYVGVCVLTENQRFYGIRAYHEPAN